MPNPTSHPRYFPVIEGEPVVARDGERIGMVAAVLPAHFKVAAESGSDFWLSRSALAEPVVGQALLAFDSDQLEELKLEQPVANADDPVIDAGLDTFENTSDEDAARRRMERGYGTSADTTSR